MMSKLTNLIIATLAVGVCVPSVLCIESLEQENATLQTHQQTLENTIDDSLGSWVAPIEIRKNYPYYISGLDDDNRPIFICEFGKWDVRRIMEKGGQDTRDFETYSEQALQRFALGVKQDGLQHLKLYEDPDIGEGTVMIIDFEGFTLLQVASTDTLSWILQMARKAGEIEKKVAYGFFINVNFVAERVINLARPLLGRIMERVEVYGTNEAIWKPRLLRKLPRDQLPEWYGGSKEFAPLVIYG